MTPDKKKRERAKIQDAGSAGKVSVRRFALTYLVLMGIFFAVIGFVPLQEIIDINGVYSRSVVAVTAAILRAFHIPAVCNGSVINLPQISLDVKFGCNGLEAVMIYSVAVLAFPSSWKTKTAGILLGFVVIQVINVLRIAALAYSGIHLRGVFEYIHLYVAQGMMIAVSLGLFFLYLAYANREDPAS